MSGPNKVSLMYKLFHPWYFLKPRREEQALESNSLDITNTNNETEDPYQAYDNYIRELVDYKVQEKLAQHVYQKHTISTGGYFLRVAPIAFIAGLIAFAYQKELETRLSPYENPGIDRFALTKEHLEKLDNVDLKFIKDKNNPVHSLSKHLVALQNYTKPRVVQIFNGGGAGSGFIYRKDGIIVTNHHVVHDSDEVIVKLYNGISLPGRVIGKNAACDLAVIKIDADNLPTLNISKNEPEPGELVMAIGHPAYLGWSATLGMVSGKGRSWENMTKSTLIQTDTAINPGNSGGPLLNMYGEVVALNQLTLGPKGYQEIHFSISAKTLNEVIPKLIK